MRLEEPLPQRAEGLFGLYRRGRGRCRCDARAARTYAGASPTPDSNDDSSDDANDDRMDAPSTGADGDGSAGGTTNNGSTSNGSDSNGSAAGDSSSSSAGNTDSDASGSTGAGTSNSSTGSSDSSVAPALTTAPALTQPLVPMLPRMTRIRRRTFPLLRRTRSLLSPSSLALRWALR